MAYRHVMIPVDLEHADRMARALDIALDLAEHYGAAVTFVAVTSELPGPMARGPTEFRRKLEALAARLTQNRPLTADVRVYVSHDPMAQIDALLIKAVGDVGADLVAMASHIPNAVDAVWPSHSARLASHAKAALFLIR